MRILLIFISIIICSCKTQQIGSGGGGGGPVPTADDVKDYINRLTTPENKMCEAIKTDNHKPSRYPIIVASGNNFWDIKYSQSISEQFDKDYMGLLRRQKINEGDLSLLHCPGYNYATDDEKKQFWILFLASLSKPESNFGPDQEYNEDTGVEETIPKEQLKNISPEVEKARGDGHLSMGLLQIDPNHSTHWCAILAKEMNKDKFTSYDIHTPSTNLQCGLLMLQWQITGVPKQGTMTPTRPELVGRLFTPNKAWYWSNLEMGKNGELIKEFSAHAQVQFKFCNRTNPIDGYTPGLSSKYKGIDCSGVQDDKEKSNCEKYLLNQKIEKDQVDITLGEKTLESKCKDNIYDGERYVVKKLNKDGDIEDDLDSSTVSK